MHAVARLMLGATFRNIQASWVKEGPRWRSISFRAAPTISAARSSTRASPPRPARRTGSSSRRASCADSSATSGAFRPSARALYAIRRRFSTRQRRTTRRSPLDAIEDAEARFGSYRRLTMAAEFRFLTPSVDTMKVVALAGGTGAAKFLRGLSRVIDPADLTIVGNTGDDLEIWGLYVSPDLDTVSYTLAGIVDEIEGVGRSRTTRSMLAPRWPTLGEPTYFGLGDKDIALHLFRTEQLRAGRSLSQVTESLRATNGRREPHPSDVRPSRAPPACRTPDGWLAFQEFFVRERCAARSARPRLRGKRASSAGTRRARSDRAADAILICPSNPISSVGPILAVPGIRSALAETAARVSAVSPIVGDAPVSGPAGKMMRAKGLRGIRLGRRRRATRGCSINWSSTSATRTTLAPPCRRAVFERSSPTASWASREREVALARACSRGLS